VLAPLVSPALSIAIVAGALWLAASGVWPAALRPRPTMALGQDVAVAFAVFVLAEGVFSIRAV